MLIPHLEYQTGRTRQSHCVTAGWNAINVVAQQQRSGQLKAAAEGKTK